MDNGLIVRPRDGEFVVLEVDHKAGLEIPLAQVPSFPEAVEFVGDYTSENDVEFTTVFE